MQKIFLAQNLHLATIVLVVIFLLYVSYLLFRIFYLRRFPEAASSRWLNGWQIKYNWLIIFGLFVLLVSPIILGFSLMPKVVFPTDPAMGNIEVSNLKPVVIKFDRSIDESSIRAEIVPELAGSWTINRNLFSGEGEIIFTPEQSPLLATRYTVTIEGIKNIWGKQSGRYLFSFQTLPLPEVRAVSIEEGDEGVLVEQVLEFELDHFPENSALISFELSPALELETEVAGDLYRVKAKDGFQKGTSYNLKVFRTQLSYNYQNRQKLESGERVEIKSLNFKTVDAPSVKSTSPSGSGLLTDVNVSIEFKQDMDKQSAESAFSITPKVNGVFSWSGLRKITFDPSENLAKNTKFQILLSKSAKTAGNELLEEDISFTFVTIGHVAVSTFAPANGSSGVVLDAAVSISFNQAVEQASAQSKFSITPAVNGSFSWSGNKMTFSHDNFSSGTKYTMTVASGVKTILGLDSKDAFSSSFTTKTPQTTLNVPSYRQAHMYSCMAVAARNALAFKGVSVSESAVLSGIGYDSTAWSGTWAEGGAVWGDPSVGIVGDVDGKANNIGWGYGSHWGPVASAINGFGRTAEIKSGWSVAGVAAEIAAGNPVIVWWVNSVWPAYEVNWKTPAGKSIRGVNSMHVQVVKGFTGTVENPLSFTVTDSGYGYPTQTFDVGTFKAKWSWFGNTAVIVR